MTCSTRSKGSLQIGMPMLLVAPLSPSRAVPGCLLSWCPSTTKPSIILKEAQSNLPASPLCYPSTHPSDVKDRYPRDPPPPQISRFCTKHHHCNSLYPIPPRIQNGQFKLTILNLESPWGQGSSGRSTLGATREPTLSMPSRR